MELVLRTVAVYALLWLLMRATGKRELAALGPFDLVLIVVIGDVVQQAVTQEDMSFTGALIVLATMGTIVLGVSAVTRRCSSGESMRMTLNSSVSRSRSSLATRLCSR